MLVGRTHVFHMSVSSVTLLTQVICTCLCGCRSCCSCIDFAQLFLVHHHRHDSRHDSRHDRHGTHVDRYTCKQVDTRDSALMHICRSVMVMFVIHVRLSLKQKIPDQYQHQNSSKTAPAPKGHQRSTKRALAPEQPQIWYPARS